jgi:methylmalonyl-CoA/ethylmalonyl-CoA epimerase
MERMHEHGTFHHVGVATRDIAAEQRSLAPLGYQPVTGIIDDPVLGIRCCLLEGGGPRIELVSDLPGCEVVTPWLRRGTKYYHLAFEIDDMDAMPARVSAMGGKITQAPRPARLFDGRPVAFVLLRSLALIEYIQRKEST